MAVDAPLHPVAGQYVTVRVGECALAVKLAALKAAGVLGTVGTTPLTFTVGLAGFPVAFVTAAIRVPGGAAAVEFTTDKVAFIAQPGTVLPAAIAGFHSANPLSVSRSEERRVGKEGRCGWWPCH